MSQWPSHDPMANGNGHGNPNPNANGFADPAALSMDNPNMFNPTYANHQQQSQSQHPATPNAQNRSQTPHQFPYNVPSVVPSKRPRPADEASIASPGHPPVNMNMSRSQTPQQAGAYPSPFPYQQHLQNANSTNVTPSPTMSNQPFRPNAPNALPQQRMQTASPHPPHQQQQSVNMSPTAADANGRMTPQTPQFPGMGMQGPMSGQMHGQLNSPMAGPGFVPGPNMGSAYPPGYAGMPMQGQQGQFGATQPNLPPSLAAQQAEVQRQYQLKMQQQQMALQNRQRIGSINPITGQQQATGPPTNRQPSQGQQSPMPQQQVAPGQPVQAFVNAVSQYMQRNNMPFDPNPTVAGRPLNIWALYSIIARGGGSKAVETTNAWSKVAGALQINEMQSPSAAMDIRDYFMRNLAPYEVAHMQHQQQNRKKPEDPSSSGQMSPVKVPQSPQVQNQHQTPQMQNRPGPVPRMTPQMTPTQGPMGGKIPNGFPPSQTDSPGGRTHLTRGGSLDRVAAASPMPVHSEMSTHDSMAGNEGMRLSNGVDTTQNSHLSSMDPDLYQPSKVPFHQHYGGLEVDAFFGPNHLSEEIHKLKPAVPDPVEMGMIDVRAISNSLQSGIRHEVRYALDVLQKITFYFPLDLAHCEDLLEIIVDCGEDTLAALLEKTSDSTEFIDIPSYEGILRDTRNEVEWSLQENHAVGSQEYEMSRLAERVLAVTRIIRNLSLIQINTNDRNSQLLATPIVVEFISNAIRHVGTHESFLQSSWRLHEFMIDVAHILSNIADEIVLPGTEESLTILHFLLAFAPGPSPVSKEELAFSSYDPKRHRYYYLAIDSFAKLLIKDENRSLFRTIFAEPSSTPSATSTADATLPIHQRYALITRAFGFAIAVIPNHASLSLPDERLVLLREAVLSQAILAADVVTGLLPSNVAESLALAWLGSSDCWVACTINLCRSIFNDMGMRAHEGWCAFMSRAFAILGHLGALGLGKTKSKKFVAVQEKAGAPVTGEAERKVDGEPDMRFEDDLMAQTKDLRGSRAIANKDGAITKEMLPNWTFVLGALNMAKMDTSVLRSLVALASLDE